jgi:ferredoxin
MSGMPQLTIDNKTVEVPAGKRLINAISDEGGSDQLHNCGGKAACTSCRVQFVSGEPTAMTQAEKELLIARGLTGHAGMRLSCQLNCDADMSIMVISRLAGSGRRDTGGRPADAIEPPPVWVSK